METKIELFPAKNPNPVLSVTKDGTVLYSNEAGKSLLHEWNVVVGEKLPSSIGDIVQRVISRNTPEKIEVTVGNRVYLLSFHPLPEEECVNIYGFDISDQKELEGKLQESKEDLAEIQKTARIGNWKWNIVTNELHWSDEVYRIFGLNPQEFEATFDAYFNYVHPDDRDYLNNAIKEAFKGEPYSVDNRIITANGEERIVHTNAEITFNEDNIPVYARGIVQDITERKQIEEILSESGHKVAEAVEAERHRLFDVLETLPAMICLLTPDYHVAFANRSFRERFGESGDRHCYEYCFGRTKPCEFCETYKVLETGQPHRWEVTAPDGSVIDAYDFPFTDVDGSPMILEMDIDITKQKKAEAKLKDTLDNLEEKVKKRTAELEKAYNSLKGSKERLAEAQKIAHIGSWDWNIVANKMYRSDELYHIFRLDPQKFDTTYGILLNYVHPDDRDRIDIDVKEALNGKPIDNNYRIILADGEERIVHMNGGVIFDEKNSPVRMRGTVQDITELRKAEETILAKEAELQLIADLTPVLLNRLSRDLHYVYVNRACAEIFGLSREEIIGKPIVEIIGKEVFETIRPYIEKVLQGQRVEYESEILYQGVNPRFMHVVYIPERNMRGEVVGWLASISDITERKKAEENLAKMEIARKKEIHHRIKNNLQVISSLLDLQSEQFRNKECIKDSEILEAFKESQNRVISMALIHEELYKGGGFETLNFSPYIEELVENLFQAYCFGNTDISLKLNLENNVFFDMDTAVPLGMIVNELVTNSLKHAFKGKDRGEIRIRLNREENEECVRSINKDCSTSFALTISDNGVGIDEDLDIENLDSLGLQLVTTLVDQLDGELELKRDNGTEFTIRFTVTE